MPVPPALEREVIKFRDTIERPPCKYLLSIFGPTGYNTLGVDMWDTSSTDGVVEFRRAVTDQTGARHTEFVACVSPRTQWILVSRDEFHIYTTEESYRLEKADLDARKTMMEALYPEEAAKAKVSGGPTTTGVGFYS